MRVTKADVGRADAQQHLGSAIGMGHATDNTGERASAARSATCSGSPSDVYNVNALNV